METFLPGRDNLNNAGFQHFDQKQDKGYGHKEHGPLAVQQVVEIAYAHPPKEVAQEEKAFDLLLSDVSNGRWTEAGKDTWKLIFNEYIAQAAKVKGHINKIDDVRDSLNLIAVAINFRLEEKHRNNRVNIDCRSDGSRVSFYVLISKPDGDKAGHRSVATDRETVPPFLIGSIDKKQ